MRILSTFLYVLGALALVGGVCMMVGLGTVAGNASAGGGNVAAIMAVMLVFVFGIGALYFVLGYFARKMHAWTNWVVAVLTGLSLLMNVVGMVANPSGGNFIGIVVALALVVISISNLMKLSEVKKAGLDPRGAVIRSSSPRSRSRR